MHRCSDTGIIPLQYYESFLWAQKIGSYENDTLK